MIARPSFVAMTSILFALAVTAANIIAPPDVWIEATWPLEVGTVRLRDLGYVVDNGRCGNAAIDSWQLIARQPDALERFTVLLKDGALPAAKLMAVAGIRLLDSTAAVTALAAVSPPTNDSILVLVGDHSVWRSFNAVSGAVRSGRLTRLLADTTPRVDC